jgi:hypothetical protein
MTPAIRWVVKAKPSAFGPHQVPIGSLRKYVGDVLPEGYIWAEGQALSRYDYLELHAVLRRPLPSWRYPIKRLREMKLRAQHKFRVPDMRNATATYREP